MSNRSYRSTLGALLLLSLYFDINVLMYSLIAIMFIEGITNFRIPLIVNKLLGNTVNEVDISDTSDANPLYRFKFESERVWRLMVASMMLITYVFFYQALWFFPWFMGFAILGAGISGVCPMKIFVNKLGFR